MVNSNVIVKEFSIRDLMFHEYIIFPTSILTKKLQYQNCDQTYKLPVKAKLAWQDFA